MNEEENKCCAAISKMDKVLHVIETYPSLLIKYHENGIKEVTLFDAIDRVVTSVINLGIDAASKMAIIDLLNNGDINKSISRTDTFKIVLKMSKDGQKGLFAFKDATNFQYVIGSIPQEFENIHAGSVIDYWYSGEYFATLDEAYKAFEKVGK